MVGIGLGGVSDLNVDVLFNPQILGFVRGERGKTGIETFNVTGDSGRGAARLEVGFGDHATFADKASFARLILSGVRPGISYLVYQMPKLRSRNGEAVNAQLRASRIVVK